MWQGTLIFINYFIWIAENNKLIGVISFQDILYEFLMVNCL
jgi:hypothetical protein